MHFPFVCINNKKCGAGAIRRSLVKAVVRKAAKPEKLLKRKTVTTNTQPRFDILPTAKAGGFLHQPPLHSNRGCCVLHDVRQALLPVCPTVRYVFFKRTFAQALYAKY